MNFLGIGPGELGLEMRRQHAERLAIDVIDDRGQKQQAADIPAEVAEGTSVRDCH